MLFKAIWNVLHIGAYLLIQQDRWLWALFYTVRVGASTPNWTISDIQHFQFVSVLMKDQHSLPLTQLFSVEVLMKGPLPEILTLLSQDVALPNCFQHFLFLFTDFQHLQYFLISPSIRYNIQERVMETYTFLINRVGVMNNLPGQGLGKQTSWFH